MALQLFVLLKLLQMVFSYSIGEYTAKCEEKGGIMLEGECYIFSEPGDEKSWEDAVEYCYENYGPLATPADPTALYDYTRYTYPDIPFWVGGYSPPHENYFIWINGTRIPQKRNEFPWGYEEPLPPKQVSDQRCVEVNYEEGYASQPCSNERQYICSLDACGAMGGVTLGYQCLLFKDDQITWKQATGACPSGGKLAIPTYPELLINYVDKQKHLGNVTRFWLGGLQLHSIQGLKSLFSWYWLNGQEIQVSKNPRTSDLAEDQQFITSDAPENTEVISMCLDVKALLDLEKGLIEGVGANCTDAIGFICEMDTSMNPPPTPVQFVTRQISSGEYVGPDTVFPKNGKEVLLHDISDPNMHMAFDIVDGQWGYIRHVMSGKILSPMGNGTDAAPMNPPDGTNVVLQYDRRPWALFALDQSQNRIIHRSGKFISSDKRYVTITGDKSKNVSMGFQFMNITNQDKEVLPYGFPVISGEWKLVLSVENPKASLTLSEKVTMGRSKSLSTSYEFVFGFEVARNERSSIHSSSCSNWPWSRTCESTSSSLGTATTNSLVYEMQRASSDTWNNETTQEFTYTVDAGQSVAVWQREFIIEHMGHKAVHLSNMFADTEGPLISPANHNIRFTTPRG